MLLVRFELAADPTDIGPDVVRFLAVLRAPHDLEDLTMCQHRAGVSGEVRQDVVLLRRQTDVDAVPADAARAEVDFEAVRAEGPAPPRMIGGASAV